MNDTSAKPARRDDVYPIGKKNPNLPFHPAVRAGDFIFVSGQVAKDEHGNMISGTIEAETAGTIESIRRILAEEGASLADVVRVTTYLEDTRDFGRYNKVFAEHFKDADGTMLSGTIEDETRGTIDSIRRILAEEGATLADVVRVTTYLEDTRDFGRYNKVFAEHFKDAVLARTTVEARAVINTKIEMDAIAYKPRGR